MFLPIVKSRTYLEDAAKCGDHTCATPRFLRGRIVLHPPLVKFREYCHKNRTNQVSRTLKLCQVFWMVLSKKAGKGLSEDVKVRFKNDKVVRISKLFQRKNPRNWVYESAVSCMSCIPKFAGNGLLMRSKRFLINSIHPFFLPLDQHKRCSLSFLHTIYRISQSQQRSAGTNPDTLLGMIVHHTCKAAEQNA